ncbi:MAG TPA: AfsR/SARP family transcriptional regulator [Pseudonocardiaceae bacterium]|nr:AfsR/SARP family transcriptional regulator [Pseudonocardiaceae bacterium]
MVNFGLLGPLRISNEGVTCAAPKAPKVRQLLALLLFLANQVVTIDWIIDELWGSQPPRSALVTVQTYVCHIRKLITRNDQSGAAGKDMLVTVSSGYMLSVERQQLDINQFRELHDRGRRLFDAGQVQEAATHLREALSLFRGAVLADLDAGEHLQPYKVRFEEDRASAHALRIQADLALGHHRELIGELRALTASRPLDEWAHARLMEALSGAGRRSEALDLYQSLYRMLDRELGIAPSPELQTLQREILAIGQHGRKPVMEGTSGLPSG